MTKLLKPLFVFARINGVPFKKVLIDGGEELGKTKAYLIPTDLIVSNFARIVIATHDIFLAELEIGFKTLMVSYLVVANTSFHHTLMGRDWIHQSISIHSSQRQELLIWNEEMEDYEMFKVNLKPFLPSANSIDARFYNENTAPLNIL